MKIIAFLLLVLSVLSLILVFIWFRDGYILGTAEGQIPFYKITRFYDQMKFAWSETNPGLGYANGIVTTLAPTFLFLSSLEKIGIPNFIVQAWFFWFCLVISGLGAALLTRELFPTLSRKYLLIASVFYLFNLISLVNIWNRFLYNYIALWTLLPLTVCFYLKGIRKQKFFYIFVIGTICALFSLGLSNPVFNIILWFLFFYITIFKLLTTSLKKERIFYIIFFILNLVYFCAVNFWWIGQIVRSLFLDKYIQGLSVLYKNTDTITTLNSLSKSLGDLNYLFRFFHKSFFTVPFIEWATLFNTPGTILAEFLITGVILFFLIKKKRDINVLFWGILLIVSLYLAKGSNPPLGELFEFLFKIFAPLQLFRNPFEKFGFIIPLAASPLLAAGIEDLSLSFQRRGKIIIYIISLVIIVCLFGYPFWSGLVFTNTPPPTNNYSIGYKVKVPQYYSDADKWLNLQGQNFRFVGFPFEGQGVTYLWEKGYQGVEPSMWLFSTPNIMFSTPVIYFKEIADQLEESFLENKDFFKIMNILNAKYLMVRSDIDFHERNMRDPNKVILLANKYSDEGRLKKSNDFGKLKFWENPFWQDKTIYATTNLTKISPQIKLEDFTILESNSNNAVYNDNLPYLSNLTDIEIIHPLKQEENNPIPTVFKFEIKNLGVYELMTNLPIIKIDKNKINSRHILREDRLFSFGSLNLEKGLHEIEIDVEKQENLAIQDKNSQSYTISDFDPFAKYEISFEYNMASEKRKKLTISQDNEQIRNNQPTPFYIRDLTPTPSGSFNLYKDTIEPRKTASSIRIYFTPDPSNEIVINNMNIKKIINPSISLIRKAKASLQKKPELSYTKISPTRYIIHIKDSQNPFVLIFSSTFNSGWEIIYPDGTKAKNHFLANSFANGWSIDRPGEYNLTLNFSLQDGLKIDSLVSLISVLLGVFVILTNLVFRRLK